MVSASSLFIAIATNTLEEKTSLGVLDFLGTFVWAFGIIFESIADIQMARFRKKFN